MSPPRENVDSGWTKSADKNQEQARGRYFKRDMLTRFSVLSYSAAMLQLGRPAHLVEDSAQRSSLLTFNGDLFTSVKTKLL